MSGDLRFGPADPTAPDVAALIQTHHRLSRENYAVEDCHALDVDELGDSGAEMHAAWLDGQAVAIGALKGFGPDRAVELKSMHTDAAARGRGIAAALLAHLIDVARDAGYAQIYLEAGRDDAYAAPARALYARAGFSECEPFGDYVAREASIFLCRDL